LRPFNENDYHNGIRFQVLSGSGHGGCLFALVPDDAVASVLASVAGLPVHAVALPRSDPAGLVCAPPASTPPAARQDAARPA
jgi:hypothetical protein